MIVAVVATTYEECGALEERGAIGLEEGRELAECRELGRSTNRWIVRRTTKMQRSRSIEGGFVSGFGRLWCLVVVL
jgi:hypothetical protein